MEARPSVIVVADDLTGGADTGVQFCPLVGRIYLKQYETPMPACKNALPKGMSIFTNSRHVDPVEAGKRAGAALQGVGSVATALLYKKIDSCLRGNIGAELDALMRQSGTEMSFVAPALPAQGRTTENGVHLIDGVPVSLTEMGRDPLCPVKESRISSLLGAQSALPVGHIGLDWIDRGLAAMEKRLHHLRSLGCRHIVFDAASDEHLQAIAQLARRQPRTADVLLVGSAGLASALVAETLTAGQAQEPPLRPFVHRWLFVCGSASEVMRRQVEHLSAQMDIRRILFQSDMSGIAEERRRHSLNRQGGDRTRGKIHSVICLPPFSEANTMPKDPEIILTALAAKAASTLQEGGYEGLFLSGGDTAEAVLTRIGAAGIYLQEEILPGLVLGTIVAGDHDGLPVITKAGSFGGDDALTNLVHTLT